MRAIDDTITDEDSPLLTPSDVAKLLGVSRSFVYREIAEERLAVFRFRSQAIRISLQDLDDYKLRHHQRAFAPMTANKSHF